MIKIILSDSKLFKNLAEIQSNGIYIDLHNDYECTQFQFDKKEHVVKIRFLNVDSTKENKQVDVIFNDVEVVKMSLPLQKGLYNAIIVDNFYRGRFEKDGILYEQSPDGKAYYYIEFDEEYNAELFASNVSALVI